VCQPKPIPPIAALCNARFVNFTNVANDAQCHAPPLMIFSIFQRLHDCPETSGVEADPQEERMSSKYNSQTRVWFEPQGRTVPPVRRNSAMRRDLRHRMS
jgi:hypothetical protein